MTGYFGASADKRIVATIPEFGPGFIVSFSYYVNNVIPYNAFNNIIVVGHTAEPMFRSPGIWINGASTNFHMQPNVLGKYSYLMCDVLS